MKSTSKKTHSIMKSLFFSCLLVVSLNGFAQKRSVILDPKLGKIELADAAGYQLDEHFIQPQQLIKLRIPIGIITHGKALPAGSCKIKIGLGSKLVLDPSYDLNTAALSNYFKWTSVANGGQQQVTGELISPLPENFQEVTVTFKAAATVEGNSTITANFLVTNHNTTTILSDEDGSNNMSFLQYTVTSVVAPVPVTTISDVKKADCSINLSFATVNEINLVRYEVEVSKDGISYVKVSEAAAANLSLYMTSFSLAKELQVKTLYVRIKSIRSNGSVLYSNSKTTDGTCDANWKLDIFPNPASNVKSVVIRAVEGSFNGKYTVTMSDMAGKQISIKELEMNSLTSFNYEFGNVAAGKYLIRIVSKNGSQSSLLKFEKL